VREKNLLVAIALNLSFRRVAGVVNVLALYAHLAFVAMSILANQEIPICTSHWR
jgi:hypothetical protein